MVRSYLWLLGLVLACSGTAGDAREFDAERAYTDLVDQVRIGPRPSGSEGARATRHLIATRLRQAGWPVEEHRFEVRRPDGSPVSMVNLIATRRGERSDRIWIGAHYDTTHIPGVNFVGANDGASGVAVLLELARVLGARPRPFTVELVFFDGEEAFGRNITRLDGLYGSRALAGRLVEEGRLGKIRALLLVDMVADRDLNLSIDSGSAPWLRNLLQQEAQRLAPDMVDPGAAVRLVDDHTPFREVGLADVLAIIDFQFGARSTPGPLWHTAGEDLSAVSQESLNRVGRLLVQILERAERGLLAGRSGRPTGEAGPPAGSRAP